jgi:U3 small nucleolar RNA-associated protein 25
VQFLFSPVRGISNRTCRDDESSEEAEQFNGFEDEVQDQDPIRDVSSESEEEQEDTKERPYNALLQLLTPAPSSAPARKKRKLNNSENQGREGDISEVADEDVRHLVEVDVLGDQGASDPEDGLEDAIVDETDDEDEDGMRTTRFTLRLVY